MAASPSQFLPKRARFPSILLFFTLLFTVATGCRTPAFPKPDLAAAHWLKRSGQLVWTAKRNGVEIVTDVNVWTSPGGECWLEAHKSGLPFLTAQLTADAWRIESLAAGSAHAGRGEPPRSIGWLQLARCLAARPPARGWKWRAQGEDVSLENPRTGERMAGFLAR